MAYFKEITATFRHPDGTEFTTVRDNYEDSIRSIQEQLKDSKIVLVSLSEAEYDDMDYMVLELTEPCQNITVEDAEKILHDAIADGWRIPKWFTPEEFVSTYNDFEMCNDCIDDEEE